MSLSKTTIRLLIFSLVCIFFVSPAHSALYYSVKDFGATGDGKTLDTKAIQRAIDTANKNGGGTVFLPSGTFLSGTIFFKNNVSLYLDNGATLLGSTNDSDYTVTICDYRSYTDNYTVKSLIYAEKVKNISILGRGTLDGQGAAFKNRRTKENPYKDRPYMIRMIECSDVIVRDVTIVNSPMWVQHYLACDDVVIDGITVDSFVAGNNDGIDIDSCDKVRISNCDIYGGDDAIVLKATSNRPCQNVTITNCVLSSFCNAFKLGTESNGGFENITFNNSTIYDTRLAGIALEMVDGGLLERVTINNIVMKNVGTAIFMRLGNRARPFRSKSNGKSSTGTWNESGFQKPGMGSLSKVVISNIQAVGIDSIGCSITGLAGHPIKDVTLENIQIEFTGGGTADLVNRKIPENDANYPEYRMFGQLPSYGFYVRHVDDIQFNNVELEYTKADLRPAFVFDDVKNLDLFDVDGELEFQAPAFMIFQNVKDALISHCRPTRKIGTFLKAAKSSNIHMFNNDLSKTTKIVNIGKEMSKSEISIHKN